MPRTMGIQKALSIVAKLDTEQLQAIEEVVNHYSTKDIVPIVTPMRIMKEHGMIKTGEDSDGRSPGTV